MNTPSLWQALSAPVPARPAPQGETVADLIVIGGGFAGLSTALHAAERGLRVVLLEAERIAWGASGRNAGFVVPNFARMDPDAIMARLGADKGARLTAFAADSADAVFGLIRRHAIACDAVRTGWVQSAATASALPALHARARQWAALGRPAEVLGAAQVAALTGLPVTHGGWIDHSAGTLNPVAYAQGLARSAEAAGAVIHEGARVTRIVPEGAGWGVRAAKARLPGKRLVLATNAHGGALIPAVTQSYFPLRVFQIATEPLPAALRARLLPGGQGVSDSRRNLFTFRFDAQNRLITGGMHVFSPGAEARVPRALHRRLARMLDLPDLPPVAFAWSGVAAVMPGYLPQLMEPAPGLLAAIACNGRGIAMTTMLGTVLADWAGGTPAEALPVPCGPPAPIRWHAVMRHAPNALLPLSMVRDVLDA